MLTSRIPAEGWRRNPSGPCESGHQEDGTTGEDGRGYEIPKDMRAMAEAGVQQARQAFEKFLAGAEATPARLRNVARQWKRPNPRGIKEADQPPARQRRAAGYGIDLRLKPSTCSIQQQKVPDSGISVALHKIDTI